MKQFIHFFDNVLDCLQFAVLGIIMLIVGLFCTVISLIGNGLNLSDEFPASTKNPPTILGRSMPADKHQ